MANNIKVSSGAIALHKSPIAQNKLGRYILLVVQYKSLLPDICNQDAQNDIEMTGREVTFLNDVDVGAWHDASVGGRLTHDQPVTSSITVSIGRAAYKSVPVDEIDMYLMGDTAQWITNRIIKSMWYNLKLLFEAHVLSSIMAGASPMNKGNTAGKAVDIDLGTVAKPRVINRFNADDLFGDIDSLFSDTYLAPLQSATAITVVMSARAKRLLGRSSGVLNLLYKGNSGQSALITQEDMATDRGFKLRVSPLMTSAMAVDTILFIWPGAYMFYANVIMSRIVTSPDYAAHIYQSIAIYDGAMFYPQGVAIAVVKLDFAKGLQGDTPLPVEVVGGGGGGTEDSVARAAAQAAQSTADGAVSQIQTVSTSKLNNDLGRSDGKKFDGAEGYIPTVDSGELKLKAPAAQNGEAAAFSIPQAPAAPKPRSKR